MRVFLDTSVVVAGIAFRGGAHALLTESFESHHDFVLSDDVREEAVRVLCEGFPRLASEAAEAVSLLRGEVIARRTYEDALKDFQQVRDPGDAHVLAAAIRSGCDLLVTTDKDLLVLRQVKGLRIVRPPEALRLIRGPDA